jgi:hypothetical protein
MAVKRKCNGGCIEALVTPEYDLLPISINGYSSAKYCPLNAMPVCVHMAMLSEKIINKLACASMLLLSQYLSKEISAAIG